MTEELVGKVSQILEKERVEFKQLILQNPNYFDNFPDSPYKAVKKMTSNTTYEELTCIGFDPDKNLLEATFVVKLPYGYKGDLCHSGSQEYVRFFMDYGGGWEDSGVVAVNVHDIPNKPDCAKEPNKPLNYVVSLNIVPKRDICDKPVLPNVRAILSWEEMPPAGNANWPPPWGNVLECRIQIKPKIKGIINVIDKITVDLIKELKLPSDFKIKVPPEYEPVLHKPIPLPDPSPIELSQLVDLYKGKPSGGVSKIAATKELKVEPHRFGLSEIHSTLHALTYEAVSSKIDKWKSLGLNWQEAVAALNNTKGNVNYEELECLGLDYNVERLVATFRIKLPNGYSGNLCSFGSKEYVAFWADWDDTCTWTYLGTLALTVNDISSIPPEGLGYSVILPVDLTKYRKNCENPKVGRVRAVLSWSVPPSDVDPNALPYWGNRLDAHVQIKPGPEIVDTVTPVIGVLGGIPISKIDDTSGLTTPDAFFALNGLPPDILLGRPCPFGGRVVLQGPSFPGYQYRVQVRRVGDLAWMTVTTKMRLVDWTGTVFTDQVADANGYFTFVPFNLNIDNVLALWDTAGDDLWEIKLEIIDPATNQPMVNAAMHLIQLDNTAPEVKINIDSGGDCKDFTVGTAINGHFVARDVYFGSFSLGTSPYSPPVGQLAPTDGTIQTLPSPGNAWALNTTNMKPCGYVITVCAVDRAIVNSSSSSVGHRSCTSTGFCVRKM